MSERILAKRYAEAFLGYARHTMGFEKAIEELNSVYMREPTNTLALYALGNCYERLGREAEAIEFYQDALKAIGSFPRNRQGQAIILSIHFDPC